MIVEEKRFSIGEHLSRRLSFAASAFTSLYEAKHLNPVNWGGPYIMNYGARPFNSQRGRMSVTMLWGAKGGGILYPASKVRRSASTGAALTS